MRPWARVPHIVACLFTAGAVAALGAAGASAAELRILSAGAAKPVISEAIPAFEKRTGAKITAEYMPVGPILKRLADSAAAKGGASKDVVDIVVLSAEALEEATAKGWTVGDVAAEVGRVGMGVAVHESAPSPDIATVEAFKQTLLAAKSIVFVDPTRGTSGKHFASVLDTLGIAAAVKPKLIIKDGGYVAEAVAKGEAALAVHQITEILPVKGIKLVGPLPAALQKITIYQAARTTKAHDKEHAEAFLAFLFEPEIRALAVKKGFMEKK